MTESTYVFDRVYPPLIKDYRDPVSQLNVERRDGPLSWSVLDKTYGGNAETANITEITNEFETWRTTRWVPIHNVRYVEDRKEKVTTRHSYTRTEHEEIKKTLTVQGKLSLPDIGFFKGGLDITATQIWDSLKRLTEVWTDSKDVEEDRLFKAHKRYIFWQLVEALDITVTTRSTTYDITAVGGPKIPIKSVIDWNTKAKVVSVVGYFEDDGSDPAKNIR